MNLGSVYLQAFGIIFLACVAVAAAIEFFWRWKTGKAWHGLVFLNAIVFIALLLPRKYDVHQTLFVWLHERHTDINMVLSTPRPTRK